MDPVVVLLALIAATLLFGRAVVLASLTLVAIAVIIIVIGGAIIAIVVSAGAAMMETDTAQLAWRAASAIAPYAALGAGITYVALAIASAALPPLRRAATLARQHPREAALRVVRAIIIIAALPWFGLRAEARRVAAERAAGATIGLIGGGARLVVATLVSTLLWAMYLYIAGGLIAVAVLALLGRI